VDADAIRFITRNLRYLDDDGKEKVPISHLVQWMSEDHKAFVPCTHTIPILPPGLYEIDNDMKVGTFFQAVQFATEDLIEFPETSSKKVVQEIDNFWKLEDTYKKYGLAYKRGILLYGPAGGGKSCTIKLAVAKIIERDGIVIKFGDPDVFVDGVRKMREIERRRPFIVIMEDLDSIVDKYGESQVLNILDGIDMVQNVVFIATTNYPEKLSQRILNRPSRFDKRFKIDMPSAQSREIYVRHLCKSCPDKRIGVDKWVKDTEGLSVAHIKELFVSVAIMGYPYAAALKELKSMKKDISSEDDNRIRIETD
jgi:SpoVK/Ycf46/Vps4 family AAA+-type ATPase